MSVREATLADLPRLLELMAEFHDNSLQARMPLNAGKVEALLRGCISNANRCAFAWDPSPGGDGRAEGFYLGHVDAWWFTDELVAFDIAVYVAEGHRGGGAAGKLFTAFTDWARGKGAVTVWPGISTGVGLERAARFYEGHGLTKVGYVFMGEL